ncbi:hypothetical protein MPTK1_3g00080 [Marchantia polymorpha subsp. ruderalis]|uniref:Protein kinase domain-containing protein n=2 Tax=Marchantia polymorpha TaxID=3197 RepID=A0A176WMN8_MARPO|nr:hypothetical protein AXG93_1467s1080 [Marchantia polymorpha subsp. ruderalis]PTQ47549.1 hypothetical protein MARPO_0007s0010 [Marchantia polymorpha]BBN03856.1 hypothetical protein Mp_3g00080 [Marchantia polymorpha subsp. ruderalis]|eukprot:PTQ47549.1 hypothetical protein MARPO_0007s0010 [Marchantia polymorpha]
MDPDITVQSFFRQPRPFEDPLVHLVEKQFQNFPKCKSARDDRWIRLPRDQQGRDLNPMYYKPIKESPWEPPRPVLSEGHTYALTDEVRRIFPRSGLHLIPRATLRDLLVPEFTGYENSREAEKWITQYSEWAIMYGLSAPLTKELLVDYLYRTLRFIPKHPIPKKEYATWEDFLRDFFLDMNIKKVEQFKAWYWQKRKEVSIIWFSHTELKLATNYFDSRLVVGESSAARLLKADMPNMSPAVVKRWKKVVPRSLAKVLREITVHRYLPKRHTPNIVHLLGYCTSVEDPLLLYEFALNGTLREHFKGKYGDYIWRSAPVRLAIAIDIAMGVGELHYNGKLPVYHRDIKPSNILLDRMYRARISDFGDAVVVKGDDDRHCPAVCGSLGYLDPVYRQTGRCDDKTDVYSLGVVLMELATGYKAWDPFRQVAHGLNPFLVGLVLDCVQKGEIESIIRPGNPYHIGSPGGHPVMMEGNAIAVELVRVALWCCCPNLHLRPRADAVAAVLLQLQQRWVDPAFRALQQIHEVGSDPTIPVPVPVGTPSPSAVTKRAGKGNDGKSITGTFPAGGKEEKTQSEGDIGSKKIRKSSADLKTPAKKKN